MCILFLNIHVSIHCILLKDIHIHRYIYITFMVFPGMYHITVFPSMYHITITGSRGDTNHHLHGIDMNLQHSINETDLRLLHFVSSNKVP